MSNIGLLSVYKDENHENENNDIGSTDGLKVSKRSLPENEDTNGDDTINVSFPPSSNDGTANDREDVNIKENLQSSSARNIPFPVQLHMILTRSDHAKSKIIQWRVHGRAFEIHNVQKFEVEVLPKYFGHGEYTTFQQQLTSYGFRHITLGRDCGAYYHGLFLRGTPDLCNGIDLWERKQDPSLCEINLYRMPYIGIDGKIISVADYSCILKKEQRKRVKEQCERFGKRTTLSDEALAKKHGIVMSDHPLDKVPFFLPLHYFCD